MAFPSGSSAMLSGVTEARSAAAARASARLVTRLPNANRSGTVAAPKRSAGSRTDHALSPNADSEAWASRA